MIETILTWSFWMVVLPILTAYATAGTRLQLPTKAIMVLGISVIIGLAGLFAATLLQLGFPW